MKKVEKCSFAGTESEQRTEADNSTSASLLPNTMLSAVFLSADDKLGQFKNELKALLVKYDAEFTIEDFGRNWSSDEKIVVNFKWDEDLSNRTDSGVIPDWIIGRWLDGI